MSFLSKIFDLAEALDLFDELGDFGFEIWGGKIQWPLRKNHVWRLLVSMVMGVAAGGASGWIFPSAFTADASLEIVKLVVTPAAFGVATVSVGCWKRFKNQERIRLDHFALGYVFVFGLLAVRMVWGR
jgi:hypothetical protein